MSAFYSSLPGMAKKLKWPVLDKGQLPDGQTLVYCKSDDTLFPVNTAQMMKFPDTNLYKRGLDMLKKKTKTLAAFKEDVQWIAEEETFIRESLNNSGDGRDEESNKEPESCLDAIRNTGKDSRMDIEEEPRLDKVRVLRKNSKRKGEKVDMERTVKQPRVSMEKGDVDSMEKDKENFNGREKFVEKVKGFRKTGKDSRKDTEEGPGLGKERVSRKDINRKAEIVDSMEKTDVDSMEKDEENFNVRQKSVKKVKGFRNTGKDSRKDTEERPGLGKERVSQKDSKRKAEIVDSMEKDDVECMEKGDVDYMENGDVDSMEKDEENFNGREKSVEKVKGFRNTGKDRRKDSEEGPGLGKERVSRKDCKRKAEIVDFTEKDDVDSMEKTDVDSMEKGDVDSMEKDEENFNVRQKSVEKVKDFRNTGKDSRKDTEEIPGLGKDRVWQKDSKRKAEIVDSMEKDDVDSMEKGEESRYAREKSVEKVKGFRSRTSSESSWDASSLSVYSDEASEYEPSGGSDSEHSSEAVSDIVPVYDRCENSHSESENDDIDNVNITEHLAKQLAISVEDPTDDEESESEIDLVDKVPDIKYKKIYLTKIVKSETTKLGKKKKSDRVYNTTSVCPFCKEVQTNFSHHLFSKLHVNETDVKAITALSIEDKKSKKRAIEILRLKGNHMRNLQVLEKKRGQIRLFRRKETRENEEFFDLDDYGPCPCCFGWIMKKNLKRHATSCQAGDEILNNSITYLEAQSDIISGRISEKACSMLVREVFTIMKQDEVSRVAKDDEVIINLGNQWIKRNIGNKVMRKYYTSSIMRLAAKLLIELRRLSGKNQTDMTTFLIPANFDLFVVAALKCSKQDDIDEEDIGAPSNAIKLGYDIKRMASAKYAFGIISGNQEMKKEGKEFLKIMGIRWHTEVTRLAREVLLEKSMNKPSQLPLPSDIRDLSNYMKSSLTDFDVTDKSNNNYKTGATLALARLTLFNRRRCHEVQATRLENYKQRKIGVDAVSIEMMRKLTDWEKQLLESQQLMQVRGKMAKAVPVIIPGETIRVLHYLADPNVRKEAGIQKENEYLFASNGIGVVRAYDAIKKVTNLAQLQMPNLVRTSKMRKYMATMVQCLDTTDAQRQWIITHLGHTMDVHMTHYRQTSDILERVDVAKMLLIQDSNQVGKYVGRRIEDINLEEIITPEPDDSEPDNEREDDAIPDIFAFHNEDLEEPTARTKKSTPNVRQKWTEEEEKELRVVFQRNFQTKKCPNMKDIDIAIKKSLKNKGVIHKRKPDNIKKKMSNTLIKIRRVSTE